VLGELKGGALKAGQLLATVDALFPQDPEATWTVALAELPESTASALPFSEVEPVLAAELGADWRRRFTEFGERSVAAASIGQVHRGVWHDGRAVAVKVQYPGVREALAADLAVVSALTRVTALVARGMALPPLVAEMRQRLAEELDYHREARVQRAFADAFRDDPEVRVPEVVAVSSRVLVTSWLDGRPLTRVAASGSAAERDRAGELYQRFLLSGPARAGWLHTDPHPGNFRLCADGRLGVLDFGSALVMPDGMPHVRAAHQRAAARRGRRGAGRVAGGRIRSTGCSPGGDQTARLPRAVHRTRPARAVPLQPGLAALTVRPHQRSA
jgi:predicted unusual protein kinase regulating ubiquinone biosynthesis (AarF/ABC1/UbiB family)